MKTISVLAGVVAEVLGNEVAIAQGMPGSLENGPKGVIAALDPTRFEVIPVLIARDGVFIATIGSAFSILVMAALLHA